MIMCLIPEWVICHVLRWRIKERYQVLGGGGGWRQELDHVEQGILQDTQFKMFGRYLAWQLCNSNPNTVMPSWKASIIIKSKKPRKTWPPLEKKHHQQQLVYLLEYVPLGKLLLHSLGLLFTPLLGHYSEMSRIQRIIWFCLRIEFILKMLTNSSDGRV